VALKNLAFDSSAVPKEQSSANVIVEMPRNIDEAPSRTSRDDSVKTLDEATQAVRDLLAGCSQEIEILSSTDKSIRKAVVRELLAALSRHNIEEREHARQLFVDHGYLDDAMWVLRTTELPSERAMAARALGLIGSPAGIMSLVEALLDDAAEVRHAAEQALAQISGPVVADLGSLLEEELNFEAAAGVGSFSTPTTVAFQETPFQNLTIEERMVEKPMSEATGVNPPTISLEEETVQKAIQQLEQRLLEAEDLARKRNGVVQKAMQELEHQLIEAEDLTRKRYQSEAAHRAEVHAARCAEAQQALRELEEQHEKELALLSSQVGEFKHALEVVTQQRAGVEEARLETAAQIRQLDEEKAELEGAAEARLAEAQRLRIEAEHHRAGVEEVRLKTAAQIRRFDEEKAQLDAAVEACKAEAQRLRIEAERQRTGVGEVRLETETQIRRLDEEKAELQAAVEARLAEAKRLRIEAERQLSEAENRSRTEQEQFLLQTADLERVMEEVARRRANVEASLHKANEEDGRLLELQQATEHRRRETAAQMRRFDEEKAELVAAVEARRAEVEEVRLDAEAQIRRFDEEKAELEAAVEARQAGVEEVRLETAAQIRRIDEVKAKLEAAVEARRAGVEEVCLDAEAQIRRFDEVKAKLTAAVEARQAEAERLRIEAQRQLSEAEKRSRAEQEQFLLEKANLERLTEEVAQRRVEVEASLHKALEDDLRLLEMQKATDHSRRPASAESLWLEPEVYQRTDTAELAHERAERLRQLINEVHNLADLPEEEVKNLRSLKSKQEELVEERKSAAVSIVG
jgi:HEAT repeats